MFNFFKFLIEIVYKNNLVCILWILRFVVKKLMDKYCVNAVFYFVFYFECFIGYWYGFVIVVDLLGIYSFKMIVIIIVLWDVRYVIIKKLFAIIIYLIRVNYWNDNIFLLM